VNKPTFADSAQRLQLLHQYLFIVFELIKVIANAYNKVTLGGKDEVARAKLLAPIAMFCAWIRHNPTLLDESMTANRQAEVRWKEVKIPLIQLFNNATAEVRQFTLKDTPGLAPLPEDLDLLGFSPVQVRFWPMSVCHFCCLTCDCSFY